MHCAAILKRGGARCYAPLPTLHCSNCPSCQSAAAARHWSHPQISGAILSSRAHKRGVSRSSRTLSAGCDGRVSAARRTVLMRTAKPCGPDAPTLASSYAGIVPAERRWQKSPVTGESSE